jgi:arylsulfatase A-like enzyme
MAQPNILIFMTDHQRADTVLAEHPCITPNLTRLAEAGVTFTNAHTPMAHCCPARATFFSGLYPSRSGIWNNVNNAMALSRRLNPGVRLFSEDLAEAGYNLAFSGKWHVSAEESPADRGWTMLGDTAWRKRGRPDKYARMKKVASEPDPLPSERAEGEILRPGYDSNILYGETEGPRLKDTSTVERAVEAIPRLKDEGKPWAMFVGCGQPHAPYRTSREYIDRYDLDDVSLPPSYADDLRDKPNYYRKLRQMRFDQLSERETRDAIRHFWAMCTHLDELFGQLLDALDETGQADNTLVLYTSDHGDYLGDHGLFHKGVPSFRGAYNVPAVVRWPAAIRDPGRRVDEFVSLADFAPTFVEASGGQPDTGLTGQSLMPFLRGESPDDWREEICTQCDGVEHYFTQRAISTKDFKYVYNGFDFDELYDLRADPHEMKNLADDSSYDEVKHDLLRRMWRFAVKEDDHVVAATYITIATAPLGPAEAFR